MALKLNEQKKWWKANLDNKIIIKNLKKTVVNNHITLSKNCFKIEKYLKKILKVKHVVLANSGTSALFMATLAGNIQTKRKVYCPIMTWSGTINGALYSNKNISFIDNKKNSQNSDYLSLSKKVNSKDMLFLTHINGKSAYDKRTYRMLKKKNVFVIEDAAQAFLVKDFDNNYLGTKFDIGCFSLSYTKMCNMVYGGFCVTNNNKLASILKTIRNNGVDNAYQIANKVGGNFKPNDLNASVGLASLKNAFTNKKRLIEIYKIYKKNLNNNKIKLINYTNLNNEFPIYVEVIADNRSKLIKFLDKKKIGYSYSTRSLSISNHLNFKSRFKNAEELDKKIIRLPSGPGYHAKSLLRIIKELNKY